MTDPVTEAVRKGREPERGVFTRRQYLTHQMILHGTTIWVAIEAVASTALAHPEWDMNEERTWDEWEQP